jgi:hypothetical protein
MLKSYLSRTLASVVGLLFAACDGDSGAPKPPTWENDVQPMLARRCLGCHADGGLGDLRLDTYAFAKERAGLAIGAIEAGTMPPWLPSEACHPIDGARPVLPEEVATLKAWVAADFPRTNPPRDPPAELVEDFRPDETLEMSRNYLPNAEVSDDYRCFVLDRDFPTDTWVTASHVRPGSAAVHHVIVYVIPPSQLAEVAERDAADPSEGYTCFSQPVSTGFTDEGAFMAYLAGGDLPNFAFPDQLGGWAPGARPRILPEGWAFRVPAGAKIVAQIHYSNSGLPTQDTSVLQLSTRPTPPAYVLHTRPLAAQYFEVPAGARDVTTTRDFPYLGDAPIEFVGMMGHMHLLGRQIRAEVIRGDDSADACLLDIPAWDFHWQESYIFPPDQPVHVQPGDTVRLSCTFDNGPEDQAPGPDGIRPPPRDVEWGEGTSDEMCLLIHTSREPYAPEPEADRRTCVSAGPCVEACRKAGRESLDCVLGCGEASPECQLCTVRAALQCGEFECLTQLLDAADCVTPCLESSLMLGSNLGRCLEAACATAYQQALACLDPTLGREDCEPAFDACLATPPTP